MPPQEAVEVDAIDPGRAGRRGHVVVVPLEEPLGVAAFLRADTIKWGKAIKGAGIQAQ